MWQVLGRQLLALLPPPPVVKMMVMMMGQGAVEEAVAGALPQTDRVIPATAAPGAAFESAGVAAAVGGSNGEKQG